MAAPELPKDIIIVGAGIIGCTTAYYLTRHPAFSSATNIRIIEASVHGAAQGSSGKAGGLVAKWAYPKELVDVSFPEHIRLAEEHNGAERWGWRFVNCGSWEGRGEPSVLPSGSEVGSGGRRKSLEKTLGLDNAAVRNSKGLPDDLLWVKEEITDSYAAMAPYGATAQVHPYHFTQTMLQLAQERGVELVTGARVTAINHEGYRVTGVTCQDVTSGRAVDLPASRVIIAAGPWSPSLIPRLPISATRAHSITIQTVPGSNIAPYVLFTEITLTESGRRKRVSPEIYSRPTGEVYACGPGDDSALPATVDDVKVDAGACESIRKHVTSISHELAAGTPDKQQACYLPIVTAGGGPIVGAADSIAHGLYIGTGHTCWGICTAPGTGKALAELVMDGRIRCGNFKKLDPTRFMSSLPNPSSPAQFYRMDAFIQGIQNEHIRLRDLVADAEARCAAAQKESSDALDKLTFETYTNKTLRGMLDNTQRELEDARARLATDQGNAAKMALLVQERDAALADTALAHSQARELLESYDYLCYGLKAKVLECEQESQALRSKFAREVEASTTSTTTHISAQKPPSRRVNLRLPAPESDIPATSDGDQDAAPSTPQLPPQSPGITCLALPEETQTKMTHDEFDELDELVRDSLSPSPATKRLLADFNEAIDWPDLRYNAPSDGKKLSGKRTFEYSDDEDEDDLASRHWKRARGSGSSETLYEGHEDAVNVNSAFDTLTKTGNKAQGLGEDDSSDISHREHDACTCRDKDCLRSFSSVKALEQHAKREHKCTSPKCEPWFVYS
ncbi:DAO-domain-containing protein [Cylindrobasidium torrendii FP15055 ss-10]|uniref:DAO-domain-containing protein n=1 Tax=Cylindrobasidium torrendii FP15055 ss-10 TaxID=1314674 RepID=A0A0D7AZR9_9AGAR|nr:DAO-domain-containing protein [Cylindrobasidium torrendii FP15055 ss-10]